MVEQRVEALLRVAAAARAAAASIGNPLLCLAPGSLGGEVGRIFCSSIGPDAKVTALRDLASRAASDAERLLRLPM